MKSQKSFSGRGISVCKDPGAEKSLGHQEEGSPEWLQHTELGGERSGVFGERGRDQTV